MRFPRVRGDVPNPHHHPGISPPFSPRARGCSVGNELATIKTYVFPACAGMFPQPAAPRSSRSRFPRVRGDVPVSNGLGNRAEQFSPRARGCSWVYRTERGKKFVFPACAGMFLLIHTIGHGDYSFPRVRGDVPPPASRRCPPSWFSPRARGCSENKPYGPAKLIVFPACAGMFLTKKKLWEKAIRFPRVRGDVPQ